MKETDWDRKGRKMKLRNGKEVKDNEWKGMTWHGKVEWSEAAPRR